MISKLPKSINPCPIKDSTVEIRFETPLPREAIYGIVYQNYSDIYPNRIELPILELPASVIKNNPELLSKPHYQLKNEDYTLQVGPKVFSLGISSKYISWTDFFKKIDTCLTKLFGLKVIDKVTRVGIRYVNFFENNFLNTSDFDIFENIVLTVNHPNIDRQRKELFMRTLLENGDYKSNLIILNNADFKNSKGSIIDIDTICKNEDIKIKDVIGIIEKGHVEEKTIFFNLLKKEFLDKLSPEY